jgi:hypothetical protein
MTDYKLVLANGAFKSGSTWLRDIVSNMTSFDAIPTKYARKKMPHWVRPSKLSRLLDDKDLHGQFLSKSHIYTKSLVTILVARPDVRILHITRDLRDVIVSHYYHYNIDRKSDLSFSDYYWSIGRFKAHEVTVYNEVWELDSQNLLATKFSLLKSDFECEVKKIGTFLGISLSSEQIALIAERTSLQALRKLRNEDDKPESQRFFRKGIVGDWQNHFSPDEEQDVHRIANAGFDRLADQLKYVAAFPARRTLKRLLDR